MKAMKIVDDAVRYPLSDWKKIFIYGIIGFSTSTAAFKAIIISTGITNILIIILLVIVETVLSILFTGYFLRIIKFSLTGDPKLPPFNSGSEMFTDGVRVFIIDG